MAAPVISKIIITLLISLISQTFDKIVALHEDYEISEEFVEKVLEVNLLIG